MIFYGYLSDKSYKNAFLLLFNRMPFNKSWKRQNANWEKYSLGKLLKFFMKFRRFYPPKSFSQQRFSR